MNLLGRAFDCAPPTLLTFQASSLGDLTEGRRHYPRFAQFGVKPSAQQVQNDVEHT